ncbi:MAG: hypothetical protein ACHQQ3_14275 [Gemmatimonadales bacterium]
MTRIRFTSLFVALVLGATALQAQATTKPKKALTPEQDSAKKLKREVKMDKVDLKKAKASGDTAKAKQLKGQIKAEKKARKKLTGKDTTSKKTAKKADATATKKP